MTSTGTVGVWATSDSISSIGRVPEEVVDVVDVAGGEVVHGDDVMTRLDQGTAEVAADEAGTAGDEDLHARTPCGWRARPRPTPR